MRATAVGLLSIFLIIGQIFGGSLAGGAVGSRIDDVGGYRVAYELFAAIAVLAGIATCFLASQQTERKTPSTSVAYGDGARVRASGQSGGTPPRF
jgi:MFS family permease